MTTETTPATEPTAGKRALIVVDVQNDFVDGSLAVPGGATAAARITRLLAGDRADDYDVVVATADWHDPHDDNGGHFATDGQQPDFDTTWPGHCVAGTHGAQFHPQLQLPAGTPVFRKGQGEPAFSGFQGTMPPLMEAEGPIGLEEHLRRCGVTQVDVVGIATDFCVAATARDAAAAGFDTRVLLELTAAVAAPTGDDATTLDRATAQMAGEGVQLVGDEVATDAPA